MLTSPRKLAAEAVGTALLVFFGDHRPSIPGVTEPGPVRHTPYVMLRLDAAGRAMGQADSRVDLSPAQLHHAILRASLSPAAG